MTFILEERLTLDSILFRFDLGGSFCFGGCFGKQKKKNSFYKLIFVVLVFKAKKQKTKTFW